MSGLEARVEVRRGGFRLEADLAAEPGAPVAVLGPNGAGKSTLVRALAGLAPLDGGRVTLDGRVLEDPAAGIRVLPRDRDLGVAFQDGRLFPWMSARDNVAYGLRARGVGRAEARRRADEALERLGLAGLGDRRPAGLSGGEAQRVALARALAPRPALLLLDEPLSAQDVRARGRTRRLLAAALAAHPGVALVVTHDPVEALALADRVVVLEEGRVSQAGPPEALLRRPATPYVAALAGVNLLAGRIARTVEGTVFESGALRLVVAPETPPPEGPARAVLPPTAIVLSTERSISSARNVLEARIVAVDPHGERVRVTLDTDPPLTAEVTRASVERLGLAPGVAAFASVKATEIDVSAE